MSMEPVTVAASPPSRNCVSVPASGFSAVAGQGPSAPASSRNAMTQPEPIDTSRISWSRAESSPPDVEQAVSVPTPSRTTSMRAKQFSPPN